MSGVIVLVLLGLLVFNVARVVRLGSERERASRRREYDEALLALHATLTERVRNEEKK